MGVPSENQPSDASIVEISTAATPTQSAQSTKKKAEARSRKSKSAAARRRRAKADLDCIPRPLRVRKRNWSLEAKHQLSVGSRSLDLLYDATRVISFRNSLVPVDDPPMGRRPIPKEDMALIQTFMYSQGACIRSARFGLEPLVERGYIERVPHANTFTHWRRFEGIKDDAIVGGPTLLRTLLQIHFLLLEPIRNIVRGIVIDSTGFTINGNANWSDCEKGIAPKRASTDWLKFHGVICRDTKMILEFNATDHRGIGSADVVNAIPLFQRVRELGFRPSIVYGDEAYWSYDNIAYIISEMRADPMIKPKEKFDPGSMAPLERAALLLKQRYVDRRPEFDVLFGPRNIIESTFSSFKSKTDDTVLAHDPGQRLIECYSKVIVHNLRCLVRQELEYGYKIDLGLGHVFQPKIDLRKWA